jgi:hypothetical protein
MALLRLDAPVPRTAAWLTPARLRDAAFCLLFGLIMVVIQYRSGAFTADLALDWDEPAHAVSSLMVHDYLVQDFPHDPLQFAWLFYGHYSKVAIGHWPPLFYLAEGIWMLGAGRSQVALLLFVALCAAGLISSVYLEVQHRSSTVAAVVSVAVLMSSKVFYLMLCGVRPDMLMALLAFWATLHCGEYMRFGSRRSRNLFVVFAVAAVLTHGRAAVLILLPFALLPLRSRIVKWKWLTAGALVLLSMFLPPLLHQASHLSLPTMLPRAWDIILSSVFLPGWPWTIHARDGVALVSGWPCAILALIGLTLTFNRNPQQQFWAAMAGQIAATMAFFMLVAVPVESRFMLMSTQAIAVLAGGGVHVLLERFSPGRQALRLAVSAAAIGWMAWAAVHVEPKPDRGYGQMVKNGLLNTNGLALIAADEANEGALIVEASLSDPNRVHTVLRASKVLASSTWMGAYRRLLFASSPELLHYLDHRNVSLVLVQPTCTYPQVAQLRAALVGDPADWRPDSETPRVKGIEIYRRTLVEGAPSH